MIDRIEACIIELITYACLPAPTVNSTLASTATSATLRLTSALILMAVLTSPALTSLTTWWKAPLRAAASPYNV
jgi:hypothetical protein